MTIIDTDNMVGTLLPIGGLPDEVRFKGAEIAFEWLINGKVYTIHGKVKSNADPTLMEVQKIIEVDLKQRAKGLVN